MHFIPVYMDKLSKGQLTFVKKRMQKYSKQTQYYVHTFNRKAGHWLPFFVKFPKVSEYFEQISRNHMWNQYRQGLYNGMFFVPAGVDNKKEHFKFHKSYSETRTSMKCSNSQMSTSCYNNSVNVTVNCNLTSTMMSTL